MILNKLIPLVRHLLSLVVFALAGFSHADSVLTSTPFHLAYQDYEEIWLGAQTQRLSPELLDLLASAEVTTEYKIALCNALGWDTERKIYNSDIYMLHLTQQKEIPTKHFAHRLHQFSTEELVIYCYLYALDHYLYDDKLANIVPILHLAVNRKENDFFANFVLTLVECQMFMHEPESTGKVWLRFKPFLSAADRLDGQINADAMNIVVDYLNCYNHEKEPAPEQENLDSDIKTFI